MSNNSTETDESVFIELIGVSPDDIPHDGATSEHVKLASEVDGLIKENHGFSTDGVSVCVSKLPRSEGRGISPLKRFPATV